MPRKPTTAWAQDGSVPARPDTANAPIDMQNGNHEQDERQRKGEEDHERNSREYWVSCFIAMTSETKAQPSRDRLSVERAARAAVANARGSKPASSAVAPFWPMTPSRIAAWTRLEKKACRKAASASCSGDAVAAGDGADGDAIGAVFRQTIQHLRGPGRRRFQEGGALQHGLGMALARAGQGLGECGNFVKIAAAAGTPPGFGEQHRVVPARAHLDQRLQPGREVLPVGYQAVMHGAFEPMAVGKAADRKGRRQPGHQPQQGDAGGWSVMVVMVVIMRMGIGCASENAIRCAMGMRFGMAVRMRLGMGMTVIMTAMAGIGAAHRLERLGDVAHRSAEPFQHRLDDMVAQDEDAVGLDCRGEMAVADMPGELGQMHGVAGANVIDLFMRGDDLDMAAVLQHQPVAVVQGDRLRQIDQHLLAA